MLIKRATRAGKDYVYGMLLSFKTRVANNFFLTLRWATGSVVKQFSSDIVQFFAGHCPMSTV